MTTQLLAYILLYRAPEVGAFTLPEAYFCQAEDIDHAEEQLESFLPGADCLWSGIMVPEEDNRTAYRRVLADYLGESEDHDDSPSSSDTQPASLDALKSTIETAIPTAGLDRYDTGFRDALESGVLAMAGAGVPPHLVGEVVTTVLDAFGNNAPEPQARQMDVSKLSADLETLRACLHVAVGDNPHYWEDADGVPIGSFLVPAVAGDVATAQTALEAYRADIAAALAEQEAEAADTDA